MEILPYYPTLDRNLVLCGIFFHNIGKVESISDDLQPGYTDAGRLIGNVALGIEILREATLSFKQFPEDILLQLEHIILSYKGGDDAGTLEAPRLPEAVFVYYIVALDCRMNLMLDVINNNPNPDWMDNHNNFHSELYNK